MGDGSPDRISQIMEQRRQMKRDAARLAADLRNEDRKRVRLLEKADRLSDADLQAIMIKRGQAKAKAQAKAAAKSKAKAKAKGKAKASGSDGDAGGDSGGAGSAGA